MVQKSLIVFGDPEIAEVTALRDVLASADPAPALAFHDDLQGALAAAKGQPVLIPVQLAEDTLAHLLKDGHGPKAACDMWRTAAGALRDMCKAHRRDVLLVNPFQLNAATGSLTRFADRLGLTLKTKQDDPAKDAPADLRLLARMLLGQHPEDQALADELEAMTLADPPPRTLELAEAAFASRQAAAELARKEATRQAEQDQQSKILARAQRDLEAERDLLRDTLSGLQQDLAQFYDTSRSEAADRDAQILLHKSAHEAAIRQLEQMRSDQLHREAILGADSLAAQARETALTEELTHARAELETVYHSRSWRVTGPLRRASGSLRRDS